MTLCSCIQWMKTSYDCHILKNYSLNVFSFKHILLHIKHISKCQIKISCHINKITTCVYVTPTPQPQFRFIGFCIKMSKLS